MIALVVGLSAFLGMSLNLAFSASLTQPDWSLALLLAAMLAHRKNWLWVLPCTLMHDLMLHWSVGISFIIMALIPFAMIYLDQSLGPGIPQRVLLLMIAVTLSLTEWGWGLQTVLLTLCLCVPLWYMLTGLYAKKTA